MARTFLAPLLVTLAATACETITDDDLAARMDDDGDGIVRSEDCDDTSEDIGPHVAESCNGVDDNCSGFVDDLDACWTRIYRFERLAGGETCWGTETTPPDACAGDVLQGEAFVIAAQPMPGTAPLLRCDFGEDHQLLLEGGASWQTYDRQNRTWRCSEPLGHAWRESEPPAAGGLPQGAESCLIQRYFIAGPQHGYHHYTPNEPMGDTWSCEEDLFVAGSRTGCYDVNPCPDSD